MLKNCLYHFHKFSLLYFFLILICIGVIYYFTSYQKEPFEDSHQGIGRGFCSIESDYTDPVFYMILLVMHSQKRLLKKQLPFLKKVLLSVVELKISGKVKQHGFRNRNLR